MPIPVTARSKARVCGRSLAEIVGSNPARTWISVCCECCVLSIRGLCEELITRLEESYRLWCVVVCDLETSRMRKQWPTLGCSATRKKYSSYYIFSHRNWFLRLGLSHTDLQALVLQCSMSTNFFKVVYCIYSTTIWSQQLNVFVWRFSNNLI